jgi:hypothetical protein
MIRTFRLILLPLVLLVGAGCGKPAPLDPVAVAGRVVSGDGKTLPRLILTFHPQEESNRRNMPSAAPNPADGKFSTKCLPGRYKVTLAMDRGDPGSGGDPGGTGALPRPGAPSMMFMRYQNSADTPWSVEVPAAGTSDIVLKLVGP